MTNEERVHLIDRLAVFYHSSYTEKNQPWVRKVEFSEWLDRQFVRIEGRRISAK